MKRQFVLLLLVGILMALCVALVAYHVYMPQKIDPLFIDELSVSEEDVPAAEKSVQTVSRTEQAGGITLTVQQGFIYPQSMCLLVEMRYPQEIDVDARSLREESVPVPRFVLSIAGESLTLQSKKTESVFLEEASTTVSYLVWFTADIPLFSPGMSVILSADRLSHLTDSTPSAPLQVSWTIETVAEERVISLSESDLSGTAVLTPFSLRLSLQTATYSALDTLVKDLSLLDRDGNAIRLEGTMVGGIETDGRGENSVDLLLIFPVFLPAEEIQSLIIGEKAFVLE